MDLFISIFSGDGAPEPSGSEQHPDNDGASIPIMSDQSTPWSFGGLIKTLATKSESVIHNYRRDLEELGSGLKKETSVIREVASRAVKDLPTSLDVGASVAQESLESVGQVIDDIGSAVWKSTSKIISHGRETLLATDLVSGNYENNSNFVVSKPLGSSSNRNFEFKRYNRLDTQLLTIQRDANTYLEEPEDLENYENWKLGFILEDKEGEIENLVEENEEVREIYRKAVPSRIDRELFWSRYFYRVHKLKQAEEARVKLVKRAISAEEDEDLSWDFDDDDENEENKKLQSTGGSDATARTDGKDSDSVENVATGGRDLKSESHEAATESVDKKSEGKVSKKVAADGGDSCKDSDISVISSQPLSSGEEELGWDEIEDMGSVEEIKDNTSGKRQRIDLHKRRIVADEEEDLSWDIEDEDELAKS